MAWPRKRVWIPLVTTTVATAAVVWLAIHAWRSLDRPLHVPAEGAWLQVDVGMPLRRVTADLAARGVLDWPAALDIYARSTGHATRIRAGEYQLTADMTPRTLLAKLVAGQVFLHQLTVIEGWRFADLLAAVRGHPAIRVGTMDAAQLMTALGEPGVHPEGQFYPDTYSFPRGTTDVELLRVAHRALRDHLEQAWQRRQTTQLATPYEALILASIIEKETALASERRLISGVFQLRLKKNMRLQTDPTVIYGLGESFDGNLRRADLERDGPYNTYTRAGLPPTPIALPSGAAIEAAVAPEPTDALYFVATGRPDGSHAFSATLEEHDEAVRAYLRHLRASEQ
jgi:UPF0755 protein